MTEHNTWIIGRPHDCPTRCGRTEYAAFPHIIVADDYASHHHAALTRHTDGTIRIEDLGSTNGTRIRHADGEETRVTTPTRIRPGDTVLIGRSPLTIPLPPPPPKYGAGDDIPTEVLEASARAAERAYQAWEPPAKTRWHVTAEERQLELWDRWFTTVRDAAHHLIAEGRRQRDAELFAASVEPDGPIHDETPQLIARLEQQIRAKVAAEIRAGLIERSSAADLVERIARLVEQPTPTHQPHPNRPDLPAQPGPKPTSPPPPPQT